MQFLIIFKTRNFIFNTSANIFNKSNMEKKELNIGNNVLQMVMYGQRIIS